MQIENKNLIKKIRIKIKIKIKKVKSYRKTPRLGFEPRRRLPHGISSPAPYQARLSRHTNNKLNIINNLGNLNLEFLKIKNKSMKINSENDFSEHTT